MSGRAGTNCPELAPERAKAQGKRVSRPPLPAATRRRIEELWQAGKSINAIRKELEIAYGTAWNCVRAVERRSEKPGAVDDGHGVANRQQLRS